jgi:Icc-related predicted phosphoesterase
MLGSEQGKENFIKRFPDLAKKTWQLIIINKIAVLLLNSNFKQLSKSEFKEQQLWYETQLDYLQKDSSIMMIIVACHHPPLTNSEVVGISEEVSNYFVKQFIKSDKCKLFISGHCHAF